MKRELDEELCRKYPLIFADRNKPMTETAMCWGFDCGNGWYNLIDVLCGMLYSDYINAKEKYERTKEWFEESGHYPWRNGRAITPEEVEELRLKMVEEEQLVPVASQVKEKFGGLRFYVNHASEKHYNYITFAENMSYRICEECGAPGNLYTDGWHTTLCEHHAKEFGREQELE
jgi:hypothetical protein